jgi:hypothetical protein
MRKLLILFSLITTPLLADQGPLIWCRAEPVSTNGDDYLEYGNTEEEACSSALYLCEKHYTNCEVTGCGEWRDVKSLDSRICPIMYNVVNVILYRGYHGKKIYFC